MVLGVVGYRVSTFARNIFIFGTNRLTARDNFPGVPADYYTPVQQYAAHNFDQFDIDNALEMTWITQEEYDQTMSYKNA